MVLAVPMITILIGNILIISKTNTADSKRITLKEKIESKQIPAIKFCRDSTKSNCRILTKQNKPSSLKSPSRKHALSVNEFSFKFTPVFMNEQHQQFANVRNLNKGSKKVY